MMAQSGEPRKSVRLVLLLSVPSFVFVATVLMGCCLYDGWDFAIQIGIGILVGLVACGIAVSSRHPGTARFTLSSLLLTMTAVAVSVFWHEYGSLSHERAVERIRQLGGELASEEPRNGEAAEWRVSFIRLPIDAADLRHLRSVDNLVSVDLDYCHFGDSGLKHVGRLKNVEWLDIEDTKTTDDGLKQLANLHSLEELILDGNDITDDGLVHLKNLKSLRHVRVRNTKVTKAGTKKFEQMLPGCQVTGYAGYPRPIVKPPPPPPAAVGN